MGKKQLRLIICGQKIRRATFQNALYDPHTGLVEKILYPDNGNIHLLVDGHCGKDVIDLGKIILFQMKNVAYFDVVQILGKLFLEPIGDQAGACPTGRAHYQNVLFFKALPFLLQCELENIGQKPDFILRDVPSIVPMQWDCCLFGQCIRQ